MSLFTKRTSALLVSLFLLCGMVALPVSGEEAESPFSLLFHNYDGLDSVVSYHNVSIDTANSTEGSGSLLLTPASPEQSDIFVFTSSQQPRNISKAKYLVLDFYTENPAIFQHSADCGLVFFNSGDKDCGRLGSTPYLKEAELVSGWNQLKIPVDFTQNADFNPKDLTKVQFFLVGTDPNQTVRLDQMRFVNDAGLEPLNILYQSFDSKDGVENFAVNEIDTSDFREGTGSYKITTMEGYANMEIIMHNTQKVDFSGVTYVMFDFYTENPEVFRAADDCAGSFFNGDAYSARAIKSPALRNLALTTGWNHIMLPLDYTEQQNGFDQTSFSKFVLYIYYIAGYPAGQVYKIDNFRLLNYEGVQDIKKAQLVKETIAAIGEVTLQSGGAIEVARDAYDGLTPAQQTLVDNYGLLQAAEQEYARLTADEADRAAAKPVKEAIAAIGEVTLQSGEAIKAARDAYDGLTPAQQALVDNYSVLQAAEVAYADLTNPPKLAAGDLDGNGEIDSMDALMVLRQIVGLEEFTPQQITAADVDQDGKITSTDALVILRFSVGLEQGLPLPKQLT